MEVENEEEEALYEYLTLLPVHASFNQQPKSCIHTKPTHLYSLILTLLMKHTHTFATLLSLTEFEYGRRGRGLA
jgi:hypothetical protein